jgi:nicotinamidase-related amidase
MLMDRNDSSLLVVDIQERLLPHIDGWQRILENAVWLVRVAQALGVPVMVSEQYPKGLGHTHPEVRQLVPDEAVATKLHFSCAAAQCLPGLPGSDRRQVIVAGIESHVCVLQTALDLRWQGREVYVVADAVGSRRTGDRELALARLRGHGVEIVSREMVAFEWLKQAGTDEFRTISSTFLR